MEKWDEGEREGRNGMGWVRKWGGPSCVMFCITGDDGAASARMKTEEGESYLEEHTWAFKSVGRYQGVKLRKIPNDKNSNI